MLKNIRCVEIEIHGFCNRKCQWCPNTLFKRDKYIEMDEKIYLSILYELKANDYNGVISYSRYNEPMAYIQLLKERLIQAKAILPDIKLVTNTNGDFISEENLHGLRLDELTIMDYDCLGIDGCIQKLLDAHVEISKLEYPYLYAKYDDINILYFIDWPKNSLIVDRGGSLDMEKIKMKWLNDRKMRIKPCFEPKYFVGIDYTGDVTPCCQIRSDNKAHKGYILGNVNHQSLTKILNSQKAIMFRNNAKSNIYDKPSHPCRYCQKEPGRYTRNDPGINY